MDAITNSDELRGVPATFMRGGTSKGLFFRWEDMPDDRDAFLCAAIGSPDPNGRQLDGMGGGISSLSKAMLVRRSDRDGVDVDYLFAQVTVDRPLVDYGGNCGNLSAAVGVFAVNQGYVQLPDGPGVVRMFNENTAKRIDCHLTVRAGRAAVMGDKVIAGVAGQGAAIRLDFLDPASTRTDILHVSSKLDKPACRYSFVDAANPCLFVPAADVCVNATELPADLAARTEVLDLLDEIRRAVGVRVGLGSRPQDVPESVPKIAIVGAPAASLTLSGDPIAADDCDVQVRMISMGKPHLAIPLTGAMCTAVAARLASSTVADVARPVEPGVPLRIATPSGVVPAMADVVDGADAPKVISASVYRTARVLMEGTVFAPDQDRDS